MKQPTTASLRDGRGTSDDPNWCARGWRITRACRYWPWPTCCSTTLCRGGSTPIAECRQRNCFCMRSRFPTRGRRRNCFAGPDSIFQLREFQLHETSMGDVLIDNEDAQVIAFRIGGKHKEAWPFRIVG